MVFPRLLLQVALGFLGFYSSPCYAAQRRIPPTQAEGPPWGPDRLAAAQATSPDADKAAAAERVAAARAAGPPSERSPRRQQEQQEQQEQQQQEQPPQQTPRRHRRQQQQQQPRQQRHTQQQQQQRQQQQHTLPDPGVGGGPFDDDLGSFYGILNNSPDAGEGSAASSSSSSSSSSSKKEGLNETDPALALLQALTSGTAEEDSDLAGLGAHPMLAELFFRIPLGVRSPQNPRLKKALEMQSGRLTSAALTMCGRREQDEDALLVEAHVPDSPFTLKALFDGHGGDVTSRFCAEHLHSFLKGLKTASPEALTEAFLTLDSSLLSDPKMQQAGSTAVVALIEELKEPRELLVSGREILSLPTDDTLYQKLDPMERVGAPSGKTRETLTLGGPQAPGFIVTIANLGDSRASLLHANGGFSILSRDHKPTNPEELQRIKRAGGFVSHSAASVPRVDGVLALSRAFGDGFFKDSKGLGPKEQRVVAVPEVHSFYALPGDVLMLACDGVYEPEKMNWVFVSHFMLTLINELQNDLTEAGVKLLEQAYEAFSGDNISLVLTRFEREAYTGRKVRRFEVSAEGLVVSDRTSDPSKSDEEDLEVQKGPFKETTQNPVTL